VTAMCYFEAVSSALRREWKKRKSLVSIITIQQT